EARRRLLGKARQQWPVQKTGLLMRTKHLAYLREYLLIRVTCREKQFVGLRAWLANYCVEDLVDPAPTIGRHTGLSFASSQARAALQSRLTVRTDTPRTCATSSSVSPPK